MKPPLKIHSIRLGENGDQAVCQTPVPFERLTYSMARVTCKRCQRLDPFWSVWAVDS